MTNISPTLNLIWIIRTMKPLVTVHFSDGTKEVMKHYEAVDMLADVLEVKRIDIGQWVALVGYHSPIVEVQYTDEHTGELNSTKISLEDFYTSWHLI